MQSVFNYSASIIINGPNVNLDWQDEGQKHDRAFHNSLRKKEIAGLLSVKRVRFQEHRDLPVEKNLIIGGNNNHADFGLGKMRGEDPAAIFLKAKKSRSWERSSLRRVWKTLN